MSPKSVQSWEREWESALFRFVKLIDHSNEHDVQYDARRTILCFFSTDYKKKIYSGFGWNVWTSLASSTHVYWNFLSCLPFPYDLCHNNNWLCSKHFTGAQYAFVPAHTHNCLTGLYSSFILLKWFFSKELKEKKKTPKFFLRMP